MYSVRPSSPPSMHAKQPRSAMTVSSTSPPSATRVQRSPGTLAYQIAPSASAQMPSGAEPGPRSAHTRRSTSSPASVIVQAVSRSACDSATTSVSSPRTTIPFGNHTSSATWRLVPSGPTTVTIPGLGSSHGIEPGMSTHARPAASTTISLKGCPLAPYGSRSGPATNPPGVVATSRPSGGQSIENGSPSTRATTSRSPSASKTSTSPAIQSHIQNRWSCHRGDSPIRIPVANTSAIPDQTPAPLPTHRSSGTNMTVTKARFLSAGAGAGDIHPVVPGGGWRVLVLVAREDVDLGAVPHGVVPRDLHVEAVVVGDRPADAAADHRQRRGRKREHQREAGRRRLVPEGGDPHDDPSQDQHRHRHHRRRVGVDRAPRLGARLGGAQPIPEAGQRGEDRYRGAADERERRGPVKVPRPRLVVADGGDDVEGGGQQVGTDGDVSQRRMERLPPPPPQGLERPAPHRECRSEGEMAHGGLPFSDRRARDPVQVLVPIRSGGRTQPGYMYRYAQVH